MKMVVSQFGDKMLTEEGVEAGDEIFGGLVEGNGLFGFVFLCLHQLYLNDRMDLILNFS